MNRRVETLELDAGVLRREAPVAAEVGGVASPRPGRHLPLDGCPVGPPPVQALPLEPAQLQLGDIQPAAVLGVRWISSLSASRLAPAEGKAASMEAGESLTARLIEADAVGVRHGRALLGGQVSQATLPVR